MDRQTTLRPSASRLAQPIAGAPTLAGPNQARLAGFRALLDGDGQGVTSSASGSPVQLKGKKRKLQGVKMSLGDFHRAADGALLGPGSSVRGVNIPQRHVRAALREPWNQWNSDTERARQVRGLPLSAMVTPPALSHVTHYSALPSIRETGLDPKWRNASTGLNAQSHTSKYAKRDGALNATYYGTSAHVGESMEDDENEEGGRLNVIAHPPLAFRLRYMRSATSVISNDRGQYNHVRPSNTVLSFGALPSRHLHLAAPGGGGSGGSAGAAGGGSRATVPLTSLRPNSGGEFNFASYARPPKSGALESSQALIEKKKRQHAAAERMKAEPPPETSATASSISPATASATSAPQRPIISEDHLMRFLTAVSAKNTNVQGQKQDVKDSEWDD